MAYSGSSRTSSLSRSSSSFFSSETDEPDIVSLESEISPPKIGSDYEESTPSETETSSELEESAWEYADETQPNAYLIINASALLQLKKNGWEKLKKKLTELREKCIYIFLDPETDLTLEDLEKINDICSDFGNIENFNDINYYYRLKRDEVNLLKRSKTIGENLKKISEEKIPIPEKRRLTLKRKIKNLVITNYKDLINFFRRKKQKIHVSFSDTLLNDLMNPTESIPDDIFELMNAIKENQSHIVNAKNLLGQLRSLKQSFSDLSHIQDALRPLKNTFRINITRLVTMGLQGFDPVSSQQVRKTSYYV